MRRTVSRLRQSLSSSHGQDRALEAVQINQGRILAKLNSSLKSSQLHDFEFSVFSQWGEDGIIQHLVSHIPSIDRTFIEFGIEDFTESNCRFLMMKDHWSGFVIDGSDQNIAALRAKPYYWRHDLTAHQSFITKDNINSLLELSGFKDRLGILSVDIDGVDWFVLDALAEWRPAVIVVEFNALFGPEPVSVPYDPAFRRFEKHFSGLYWGAGLGAFAVTLDSRGYALVGTNSVCSNAFFVKREFLSDVIGEVSVESALRPVPFRDVRDDSGGLITPTQEERVAMIAHLPLIDVVSGNELQVSDLGL